jgi:signal transduction histidine kinase/ActR/RegA family two-component response regulator
MGGAMGLCHRERRRIVVEDVTTDPRFEAFQDIAEKAGVRAIHSTPLITRSGVSVGVLQTHFRIPHKPTAPEMHMADLCARQAVDLIENARLYTQLLDADRAKNEFLAVLAHELRNPLAPIRNATRILRLTSARSEAAQQALQVVDRQMKQMTRLIDDLLDVARITGDKLELRSESIEVNEILVMAVESSGATINQRNLELMIESPTESTLVHGDPTRLAQVVSNLLDNAAKFTAPGGQIRLVGRHDGAEAVITVEDTGIGIPAAMLPSIFDMFTQANLGHDTTHRGLGIGLTLVKRLVALHGGSVSAISDGPDRGSRFEVRLPLMVAAVPRRPENAAESAPAVIAVGRRVLVVEDNSDSASSLKTLLGLMGHQVTTAPDGLAGLAAAEEFRPHVVLLDIGIPLINGHEVAKRIRKESWGQRILLIATTGWSAKRDMELSREAGFDHHLVKPVDPERLRILIQGGDPGIEADEAPKPRS